MSVHSTASRANSRASSRQRTGSRNSNVKPFFLDQMREVGWNSNSTLISAEPKRVAQMQADAKSFVRKTRALAENRRQGMYTGSICEHDLFYFILLILYQID